MQRSVQVLILILVITLLIPVTAQASQFQIGPVSGITTAWHPAPETMTVPLGTTLTFKRQVPAGAKVTWTGAQEMPHDQGWSVAECHLSDVGGLAVRVEVVFDNGGRIEESAVIDVVAIDPAQISVSPIQVSVDPVELDEEDLNASTYEYFLGPSIAGLRQLTPYWYRTSTERPVKLTVEVDPPAFAALTEWRTPGRPARLGTSKTVTHHQPARHWIIAGPTANQQAVFLETYKVKITSHVSNKDVIPAGTDVTFTAVTEPPGFEEDITWLASTKYGESYPVMGTGPEFTVWFEDTWGPNPATGEPFQWLGVKADNSVYNQDEKQQLPLLEFFQVDLDLAGDVVSNSDWGSVDVTFMGSAEILYFNLTARGTWQVQNIPVLSTEGDGVIQTLTLNFDLNTTPGTAVDSLDYAFDISNEPQPTMPTGSTVAEVNERTVIINAGEEDTTTSTTPAREMVGGAATVSESGFNSGVPNQEAGSSECVPAAISNSLMFLNSKHSLGMAAADITIEKMKDATGWTPSGSPTAPTPWWDLKDQYMQDNDLPVTTTTTMDFDEAIMAMNEDCDVEIRVPGHAAVVTAIVKLANGKFGITVQHDTKQGSSGGTKREIVIYDPSDGSLWDGMWFDGNTFDRFVIECPTGED